MSRTDRIVTVANTHAEEKADDPDRRPFHIGRIQNRAFTGNGAGRFRSGLTTFFIARLLLALAHDASAMVGLLGLFRF